MSSGVWWFGSMSAPWSPGPSRSLNGVLTARNASTHPFCARSLRIREAIELCLEVEGDTGRGLDFVGVQRIRLAS